MTPIHRLAVLILLGAAAAAPARAQDHGHAPRSGPSCPSRAEARPAVVQALEAAIRQEARQAPAGAAGREYMRVLHDLAFEAEPRGPGAPKARPGAKAAEVERCRDGRDLRVDARGVSVADARDEKRRSPLLAAERLQGPEAPLRLMGVPGQEREAILIHEPTMRDLRRSGTPEAEAAERAVVRPAEIHEAAAAVFLALARDAQPAEGGACTSGKNCDKPTRP